MRARVQAHSGDTFYQFLICELWPLTWQPLGLQHLRENSFTLWGLPKSAADRRGPKSATGWRKWGWRRGKQSVWELRCRQTKRHLYLCCGAKFFAAEVTKHQHDVLCPLGCTHYPMRSVSTQNSTKDEREMSNHFTTLSEYVSSSD